MKVILKQALKKLMSDEQVNIARAIYRLLTGLLVAPLLNGVGRYLLTPINKIKNSTKKNRFLELGPGGSRIKGFETLNVVWSSNVDYVVDASKKLPFKSESFDIVYASHILEHTPWFSLTETIKEWVRVLKVGGQLEIWVPDGYKLSSFIVDIENGLERIEWFDNWRPYNPRDNPYFWANGRLLYGARHDYPSWHTAILTPKMLCLLMNDAGLSEVREMNPEEVRGYDHGWINLGVVGRKL